MENKENDQLPIELVIDPSSTITHNQAHVAIAVAAKPSILTILHAGYFRISISFGSQALLWKILSNADSMTADIDHDSSLSPQLQAPHRVFPSMAFVLLWYISLFILLLLSVLFILRCFFHFNMVKAEFIHYVGNNYLFAPWISWLLLIQSAPLISSNTVFNGFLLWVFVGPVIVLDLKIYGQWFTTEKRFLSMVANPTSQVSVIGNLVCARAAAQMGWREIAVCLFSLGMAHYIVVFVTLYQRLSGSNHLPAKLRPVFFLFIGAPSMASLAWNSITGTFDTLSKMLFFLSLFLFISLVGRVEACRPALFKKSMKSFNIAWWAYSFPLTFLALASTEYAHEVKGHIPSLLMLILSALSVLVFFGLMLFTAFNTNMLFREKDSFLRSRNDIRTKTRQNPFLDDSNYVS